MDLEVRPGVKCPGLVSLLPFTGWPDSGVIRALPCSLTLTLFLSLNFPVPVSVDTSGVPVPIDLGIS